MTDFLSHRILCELFPDKGINLELTLYCDDEQAALAAHAKLLKECGCVRSGELAQIFVVHNGGRTITIEVFDRVGGWRGLGKNTEKEEG